MKAEQAVDAFLDHLWLTERLAANTLAAYRRDLNKIAARLHTRNKDWLTADGTDLAYALFDFPEKATSQARALSCLRRFYGYLGQQSLLPHDPTLHLKAPRAGRSLPLVINEAQVTALLAAPDIATAHGLRDSALLEVMYATGLRVSEAVALTLGEIDLQRGVLHTVGKGDKERLVPLGEVAVERLQQYLATARTQLLKGTRSDDVFVSQKRGRISRQLAWMIVKRHAATVGIAHLTPHGLRHAFATHLVNHGADLRVVQMLLGHADIGTTQIYTHIAAERLKNLVRQHHPRG
ncbi:MAG: site-specific tyrosine recombinase XerD [Neisseria sp.]|nr:site-specific tyrosine recombinase XerD [Neisseria sp.]